MAFEIFKLVGSIFVDSDEANKSIKKTDENAEGLGNKLLKGVGTAAKWGAGIATAAGAAAVAAGAALVGIAENTREYRTEMGKLETAYTTAGHSNEAAANTYKALQSILGETDQSVEAASHLAKLCQTEEELNKWTDICTGVYATFGNSIPIEGLAEAANETAKVGQVTGAVADALNWAGVSEDAFNESLSKCSTEQERQALIAETLNGLYADAADAYQKNNAEVINANKAQENLNSAMARLGEVIEPVVNEAKGRFAELITTLIPFAETIASTVVPPLMNLVEAVFPVLIGLLTSLMTFISSSGLGEMFAGIFTKISDAVGNSGITFTDVCNVIQTLFQSTWAVLSAVWETVGIPLFTFIQQIVGVVADYFGQKMPAISGFFSQMVSDISAFWENNLKPCLDAIGDFLNNVLAPVFELVFNTLIVPYIDAAFKQISDLWNNTLKPIFTGITDFLTGIFTGNWEKAFGGLSNIVKGIFNGMITLVKTPLNTIIGIVNKFIGGLNKLKVPDFVPEIGGKGINIPKIPLLAKGGTITQAGRVVVGDAGPEILDLPVGARVTPLSGRGITDHSDILYRMYEVILELLDAVKTQRMQVALDGGVLAGEMYPAMNRKMGENSESDGRGGR